MKLPDLPQDLLDYGFKLVWLKNTRRYMAVSMHYGGSFASRNMAVVIRSARAIAQWCEQQNEKNT